MNDSKATNVDSTVVALRAFPAGKPLVLLARRPGQGRALRAAAAALPGAGEGAPHPRARTPRPSSGSSATSAPPSPAATSPPRWPAPPAWRPRATWCCSPRPARATTSSATTRSGGTPSAASPRRSPCHERRDSHPAPRRAPAAPALDPWLLGAVLLLTCLGLVMVYSASRGVRPGQASRPVLLPEAAAGGRRGRHGPAPRSSSSWATGASSRWPCRCSSPSWWPSCSCSPRHRQDRRRRAALDRLGVVRFQPAEAAKVALVLYLARSLARKREQVKMFSIGFLPHVAVTGLLVALVLAEPDLGTAVILLARPLRHALRRRREARLPRRRRAARHPHRLEARGRHALPHAAHPRLPRPLAAPRRRRLPDRRVAARPSAPAGGSAWGSARARRSSSSCPRRTPTSSSPSSARSSASWAWRCSCSSSPSSWWRGLPGQALAPDAVRRLPRARPHHAHRRAGAREPGGGARAAAHQGAHPAVRQLRRQLAHDHAGRRGDAALGQRGQGGFLRSQRSTRVAAPAVAGGAA